MASIYLEDVLAGQHLSPFTLGEFEEHLVHVQRSAENLYFYVWLADYTKQYREWEASLKEKKDPLAAIPSKASKPSGLSKGGLRDSIMPTRKAVVSVVPTFVRNVLVPKTKPEPVASQPQVHDAQLSRIHVSKDRIPDELRKSFEGLQTFVIPPRQSSQVLQEFELELNISEQLKDQFKHQAENSMDPEIFLTVKDEVRTMLSDSMRIWLMDCSGNSDRHRAQLTLCIGAFCVSLAVIGTVLFMVKTASVKIRLSLSPLVWIGLEIFFCGLFRTCPLIFMFGSFRQIHVWELGRAKEAAAITEKNLLSKRDDFLANRIKVRDSGQSCLHVPGSQSGSLPPDFHPSSPRKFWDLELNHGKSSDGLFICNGPKTWNPSHLAISMSCPSPKDAPAFSPTRLNPMCSHTMKQKPRKHKQHIRSHSSSAPIFGPLTRVMSPIAIRSHRMSILKSVVLATVLTSGWITLCLLVHLPYVDHS